MKPAFKIFLRWFVFTAIGAAIALGQQNLILRAVTGQGPKVEKKYSLTLVQNLSKSGDVALVTAGDATATQAFLTAAAADPLIQSVEVDQARELDESDSNSHAANSAQSKAVDPLMLNGNGFVNFYGVPVLAGYANQKANTLLEIPAAQSTYGLGNVVVAIIDTGIDPTHPALAGNVVSGYDFITNTAGIPSELANVSASALAFLNQMAQPQVSGTVSVSLNGYSLAMVDGSSVGFLDGSSVGFLDQNGLGEAFGHGTMVAGLIHLVAPGAKIMPLRAFQTDGSGQISDVVKAIYYATDHGAKVINMSFSTTTASPALTAAIQYATSHRVITVAAAGNAGSSAAVYPAGCGAIGVASINAAGLRSFFSNYGGADARTSAPGEALVTAYPGGGYVGVWGTSFSAALVSGTAAIAGGLHPRSSQGDFSDALERGKKLANGDGMGDASLDVLLVLQGFSVDN